MRASRPVSRGMRLPLLAWSLLLAAAASAVGAADVSDRQVRTLTLGDRTPLSIEATNAVVRLIGERRADTRLEVERRAPSAGDLGQFPLIVRDEAEGTHVSVVQTGGTDAAFRAEITILLPERALVSSLRIGEGRLEVRDFHGRLTADVRRGAITGTQLSGVLRLETGIGAIDLQRVRLDPDGLLRLRTFNGDIRLAFADRPVDARVMALALNGSIASTIALTMKTAWGPRWGEATLGQGTRVVSLDVVSGHIVIEAP